MIKKIISIVLGIFVVSSIVYWAVTESANTLALSKQGSEKKEAIVKKSKIINGLYFHGTNRCYTCNLMEGYIRDVIREHFGKENKDGKLTFESINIEESTNNHYIQDYQLQSISFFLSLKSEGKEIKFENVNKIWQLAKNESAFKRYIQIEINKFLEM